MFWLDRVFDEASSELKDKIASGKTLLVRDEKTASGRVHVGSMRALGLHAAIAERLREANIPHTFKYEINDFDPMDGLPVYLDASVYQQYMGKPLYTIPSPEPTAKNFAEYFANDYKEAIKNAGFMPEFYLASEVYLDGRMNDAIRRALENAATIRTIYKEVSGAERPDTWLPISVVCENCGKVGTTKATSFDGEKVSYTCYPKAVDWAEGCGHQGSVSPFNGNAKLPWKVEWAAKWFVHGVDIEGGGKDHYSKGGARDVAERISKEVYAYEPPFGVPNEFFLIGGKKMSSSKGQGSSAREVVELVPGHMFRLALYGKDINQQINFDPAGDTIPILYDTYDRLAEKFWSDVQDDDTRLFKYVNLNDPWLFEKRFLPRFSQVAFIVQMPHLTYLAEIETLKGSPLSEHDIREAEIRAEYAKRWLKNAADDEFKFELQDTVPAGINLNTEQKSAVQEILSFITAQAKLDGQTLHTELHEIRKRNNLEPKDFFGPLYTAFLGKDHGPKIGWFLSVLDRDFLVKRLTDIS